MTTKAFIEFGPYRNYRPISTHNGTQYKYPWDKITKTGQDYGFFVGVKNKPKPPSTLKYRIWKIAPAERQGKKGYYVYVHSFTNGYKPEEEQNKHNGYVDYYSNSPTLIS
jgi:hypothetical protein